MTRFTRILVLCLFTVVATPAASQSSIVGTVYDSLSVRGQLSNAVVVLVERSQYATTDAVGRFRFEDVPVGRYSLGVLHTVLDSFDLVVPLRVVEVANGTNTVVALATPSAASAYMFGCAARLSEVANKADVVAYLKISTSCAGLARRAARETAATVDVSNSAAGSRPHPQMLQPVVVRDSARSMSPMVMYGFEERRRLGLGKFITQEFLAKQQFQTLTDVLASVPGVHIEYGTSGQPVVYLRGNKEGYCVPTYFIDGMPREMPRPGPALRPRTGGAGNSRLAAGQSGSGALGSEFSDLSAIAPPWVIKGVELYSSPGAMPAQYDLTSSTGCGSIVIWTR